MARLKVTLQFRARLSEKLMDLGNLAVAALVFSQFIAGKEIALTALIAGVFFMILCYIVSYLVSR